MRKMYSKKQVEDIVLESLENADEVVVGGDLTANTLEQEENNWETSFNPPETISGLSIVDGYYAKICKINKMLYVVFNGKYENGTENSITLTASTITFSAISSIPSEVSSKIYRQDGTALNEDDDLDSNILKEQCLFSLNDTLGQLKYGGCTVTSTEANQMTLYINPLNSITIPAGEHIQISLRFFITL